MVLLYEPAAASDEALQVSARLAGRLGSEVTVLCLAAHEHGAAAHQRRRAALGASWLARQGVLARSHVVAATPSDGVARIADICLPADLVVVRRFGSLPDAAGRRVQPGAIAARCGRPVLMVPDAPSGIHWPPRRLLLLSSGASDRPVAVTAELAGALGVPVLVVQPFGARSSPGTAADGIAERLNAAGLHAEAVVLDRARPLASLLSVGPDGLPDDLAVAELDPPAGVRRALDLGDVPLPVLLVPPEAPHPGGWPVFLSSWRSRHAAMRDRGAAARARAVLPRRSRVPGAA
jgi:hypothetical protein